MTCPDDGFGFTRFQADVLTVPIGALLDEEFGRAAVYVPGVDIHDFARRVAAKVAALIAESVR